MLCRLDDLADRSGKGFGFGGGGERFEMFIVRRGGPGVRVRQCLSARADPPSTGRPTGSLTRDRENLLCATHGARFRIEDGFCVAGPCPGASLTPVPVAVEDGNVVVAGPVGR